MWIQDKSALAQPREGTTKGILGGPKLDQLLFCAHVLFVAEMGEDNVRETFELINDDALLAVKLLAVLIHSLLGDLANPGQSVVEFFVRVAPVGDVGDSGEGREDDGFLEIVVTLEMAAELKHISESVLDRCGLRGFG